MATTTYKNFGVDIVQSLRTGWYGAIGNRDDGTRIFTSAAYHSPTAAYRMLVHLIDAHKKKGE